ncbi:MAG: CRTAC1 family protein [Pseudomonadota bacterium]
MNIRKQALALAALALAPAGLPAADIAFEETAQSAGINEVGASWGTFWGDFDGDGWPDFWATNHGREPGLYVNQRDGTFVEVAQSVLAPEVWARYAALDAHGATWGDYNNDGRQDLFENSAGGSRDDPNHLFLNDGGANLVEVAPQAGVDLPNARPRTPLWYDWNRDGLLDLVISATGAGSTPAILMQQTANGFMDVTAAAGVAESTFVEFSMLSDLTGDGTVELAAAPINRTLSVYAGTTPGLEEVTATLGIDAFGSISDVGAGDFDGDLATELFMVQGELINGFDLPDADTLEARLNAQGDEVGVSFAAVGTLDFSVFPNFATDPAEIRIGAAGVSPSSTSFTLSSDNPDVQGIASHAPGTDTGLFIGYDVPSSRWTVLFSHPANQARNLVIDAPVPVTAVQAIGYDPLEEPEFNLLLDSQGGIYTDVAALAGVRERDSGRNVAVGDFDNDGDLDAYVVATGPVTNQANVLYANNGDGTFVLVPDAGGAGGTTDGRGDAVSVVDYDRDGWLDLMVTNGKSKAPFESDGPYQLFRNLGGTNHWLEIDLEGVLTNRDGVGARVELTAGGVTQVREQRNGMHFRAQDHARLHFGLGTADVVDQLVVHWPGGDSQLLGPLPADHLVHVLQPDATTVLGEPRSVPGATQGFFAWKETFDGDYRLRLRGDGVSANYTVRLVADAPPLHVTGIDLERPDTLDTHTYGFEWSGQVTNREDGIDIGLPPGAQGWLAVSIDGVSNPRQLRIGADSGPLAPAGWLLPVGQLDAPPAFQAGEDLGLFAGRTGQAVVANWSAAGDHEGALVLAASEDYTSATPIALEPGDSFAVTGNVITVSGEVAADADGVTGSLPANALVALDYEQDGLFQRQRIVLAADGVEQPNAYRLPVADPVGRPAVAPDCEGGVALWRHEDARTWTLHLDGGRTGAAASGHFRSGGALRIVARAGLDKNDRAIMRERRRVLDFALTARPGETVEIEFQARPRRSLSLDLDRRRGSTRQLAIGAEGWPVQSFPVRLN